MIPNFKTYLNETYWSGMNRRSQGTIVRKENDIERFDRDGLFDLISDTFEFKKDAPIAKILTSQTTEDHKYISLPILWVHYHLYRMSISFNIGKIKNIHINIPRHKCNEWCPELSENFLIVENDLGGGIYIYPKETGKITNRFCMDVIETINQSENGVLQKREN